MYALRLGLNGKYLSPALDDDGTESFLCWPNIVQAKRGRVFQTEFYGMDDLVIVDLKTGLVVEE